MGKTVIIMVALIIVVVGTIIVSINSAQLNLSSDLSGDNDMKLAKFISNTYAHNAVKDIRTKFINGSNITLIYAPSKYKQESDVLNIANSEATVYVYTDSLPGIKHLVFNEEWGVISIGRVNASVCTTKTVYKRMPFAEFGLFTNSFPNNSYYGDGESLDGPVYVNGYLGIGTSQKYNSAKKDYPENSGPVFTDIVFVTQTIKYTPTDFSKYFKGFKGGTPITKHEVITMPVKNSKLDLGFDLTQTYQLTSGSNTYSYIFLRGENIKLSKNSIENDADDIKMKVSDLKSKGYILYNSNASKQVRIRGFLKGRLSIVSEGDMYADSSIVYQSVYKNNDFIDKCTKSIFLPLPNNDNSMLGLMCNGNFIVSNNCEPTNYNVLITANILSNKQITIIETGMGTYMWNWNNKTKEYTPRHFLCYGGRTQNTLQSATYNPSNKHGLREVINYDRRLKDSVPPGAPYTDKGARISIWKESFKIIRN